ncbi:adenylate/guanylate cyclase domain-containing protein [Salinarimonas sp. NSM]|uniref:adenylate/guanylate cyclase domain-containing protein n=1 Tax=Salinarimonas sp. NSM TaxID=3458003 RepID=UPI004036183B
MPLADDLKAEVTKIFQEQWSTRVGRYVPAPEALRLGNDAVELDPATVLYADLDGSTNMVDSEFWQVAAEVYKTYLHCAAKIIRSDGGTITAYDGDRVMAVFIGGTQTTDATRCALRINYAIKNILNPIFRAQYPNHFFEVKHVVGIDVSPLRAARTGVRGDNDLVWVGRAANYAAKLTSLGSDFPTRITGTAYNRLQADLKENGTPKRSMWEKRLWTAMDNMEIYRSTWWWSV